MTMAWEGYYENNKLKYLETNNEIIPNQLIFYKKDYFNKKTKKVVINIGYECDYNYNRLSNDIIYLITIENQRYERNKNINYNYPISQQIYLVQNNVVSYASIDKQGIIQRNRINKQLKGILKDLECELNFIKNNKDCENSGEIKFD
jgi:hypothetical protein